MGTTMKINHYYAVLNPNGVEAIISKNELMESDIVREITPEEYLILVRARKARADLYNKYWGKVTPIGVRK